MPSRAWDGYHRFCPLARGLDVLGDRWTMVVIHELMAGSLRYHELKAHLPGIGNNVLSDRLRRLQAAGLIERSAGEVGEGVRYAVTDRAEGLRPVFRELRRWGATMQIGDPVRQIYDHDISYAAPEQLELSESYEWRIGDKVVTLTVTGQSLRQEPGPADDPTVVVTAPLDFLQRWAAGDTNWDKGRANGEVSVTGSDEAWDRMLLATAYPGRPAGLAAKVHASLES
ncbi:MAG: helix-turn-helix domain-containing protein [Actinomycetota bacterium]